MKYRSFVFALALVVVAAVMQVISIRSGPSEWASVYVLVLLPVSAVLAFGGWPRRFCVVNGLIAGAGVLVFALADVKYVLWLHHVVGGVPEEYLLETSAVLTLLAFGASIFSAILVSIVSFAGWMRVRS